MRGWDTGERVAPVLHFLPTPPARTCPRSTAHDLPASFMAFFMLGEGEDPTAMTVADGRLRSVMTWLDWEVA